MAIVRVKGKRFLEGIKASDFGKEVLERTEGVIAVSTDEELLEAAVKLFKKEEVPYKIDGYMDYQYKGIRIEDANSLSIIKSASEIFSVFLRSSVLIVGEKANELKIFHETLTSFLKEKGEIEAKEEARKKKRAKKLGKKKALKEEIKDLNKSLKSLKKEKASTKEINSLTEKLIKKERKLGDIERDLKELSEKEDTLKLSQLGTSLSGASLEITTGSYLAEYIRCYKLYKIEGVDAVFAEKLDRNIPMFGTWAGIEEFKRNSWGKMSKEELLNRLEMDTHTNKYEPTLSLSTIGLVAENISLDINIFDDVINEGDRKEAPKIKPLAPIKPMHAASMLAGGGNFSKEIILDDEPYLVKAASVKKRQTREVINHKGELVEETIESYEPVLGTYAMYERRLTLLE